MRPALSNPWWIVVGAILGQIVGTGPIITYSTGILTKSIAEDLRWERTTVLSGMVVALWLVGILTPFVGRLVDRYGVRAVLLPGSAAFAAAVASLAFVPPSPWIYTAVFALVGITGAVQSPLAYSKSVTAHFDRSRGVALGFALAGVGLGAAITPQFAAFLAQHYGWRGAFLGLGGLIFVLAFPAVFFFIRDPARDATAKVSAAVSEGLTARQALGNLRFWKMIFCFFAIAAATAGVISNLIPFITDRGLPATQATFALSTAGLALIGGRILAGILLDRVWASYVAVAFILMPLGGILLLLNSTSTEATVVATVLIGLGLGAEVDLIAYMISRYLGLRAFGEIYGYMYAAFMFGSGGGPLLVSFCHDRFGSYDLGLEILAGLLAACAVTILTLGNYVYQPTQRKPSESGPIMNPAAVRNV